MKPQLGPHTGPQVDTILSQVSVSNTNNDQIHKEFRLIDSKNKIDDRISTQKCEKISYLNTRQHAQPRLVTFQGLNPDRSRMRSYDDNPGDGQGSRLGTNSIFKINKKNTNMDIAHVSKEMDRRHGSKSIAPYEQNQTSFD